MVQLQGEIARNNTSDPQQYKDPADLQIPAITPSVPCTFGAQVSNSTRVTPPTGLMWSPQALQKKSIPTS